MPVSLAAKSPAMLALHAAFRGGLSAESTHIVMLVSVEKGTAL
jgi:hypothetical protein